MFQCNVIVFFKRIFTIRPSKLNIEVRQIGLHRAFSHKLSLTFFCFSSRVKQNHIQTHVIIDKPFFLKSRVVFWGVCLAFQILYSAYLNSTRLRISLVAHKQTKQCSKQQKLSGRARCIHEVQTS